MCLPHHHKNENGLILVSRCLLYIISNSVNTQFSFLLIEGNLWVLSEFTCQEKISSLTDPMETGYLVKNNPLQVYGYVTFFCVSASLRKLSLSPWLSQTVVRP